MCQEPRNSILITWYYIYREYHAERLYRRIKLLTNYPETVTPPEKILQHKQYMKNSKCMMHGTIWIHNGS
jgi:hypothetical protein